MSVLGRLSNQLSSVGLGGRNVVSRYYASSYCTTFSLPDNSVFKESDEGEQNTNSIYFHPNSSYSMTINGTVVNSDKEFSNVVVKKNTGTNDIHIITKHTNLEEDVPVSGTLKITNITIDGVKHPDESIPYEVILCDSPNALMTAKAFKMYLDSVNTE